MVLVEEMQEVDQDRVDHMVLVEEALGIQANTYLKHVTTTLALMEHLEELDVLVVHIVYVEVVRVMQMEEEVMIQTVQQMIVIMDTQKTTGQMVTVRQVQLGHVQDIDHIQVDVIGMEIFKQIATLMIVVDTNQFQDILEVVEVTHIVLHI